MDTSSIQFLLDRFKRAGDNLAIIADHHEVTYRQLLKAFEQTRHSLHENGIRAGSVVLLKGDFSNRSVAALLALFDIGAIVILLAPSSIEKYFEFVDIGEAEFIVDTISTTTETIITGRTASHPLYQQLTRRGEAGLVIFSSGSTGSSKGVVHSVQRLMNKFHTPRHNFRTISFLLFDHIAGVDTLFYCLSNSSAVVTLTRREPDVICAAVEQHKVEVLPTAPSFLNLMLVSGAHERHDLSSLKIITYGSEMMPQSTLERCADILPHVKLIQRYGTSELGSPRSKSLSNSSRWIKIGGEGVEWRVVDDKLELKSSSAMLGYLNAPDPFTKDGFFKTGDRVEVLGEFIRFLGRDSDVINIGGQKVFPAEIESCLQECELVAEVSVYGEPNPLLGAIVVCQISPISSTIDAMKLRSEVRKYLAGRVESYKIPQKIIITQQALTTDRFKTIRRKVHVENFLSVMSISTMWIPSL